jgi:predicted transcriptional regulator
MTKANSLQAVLDRAQNSGERPVLPIAASKAGLATAATGSRRGTKLIGGHFAPEVSTQLRILAAEEGTTSQRLLAEALDDLFVKKGRGRIASIT